MTVLLRARARDAGGLCAAALREGGVAVIPTDTVYGLAADVFQDDAVSRIFAIKRRPADAPVPVLLATAADLPLLCAEIPRVAWKLINQFWPGPLTLVLPARPSVSPVITAGTGTVAVRVPAAHTCLRVLESLGVPVIGTSANRSGNPAAGTAQAALEELGGDVEVILEDDSAVAGGRPSTVVSLVGEQPVIYRAGVVSADAIRTAVGARVLVRQELTARPGPA